MQAEEAYDLVLKYRERYAVPSAPEITDAEFHEDYKGLGPCWIFKKSTYHPAYIVSLITEDVYGIDMGDQYYFAHEFRHQTSREQALAAVMKALGSSASDYRIRKISFYRFGLHEAGKEYQDHPVWEIEVTHTHPSPMCAENFTCYFVSDITGEVVSYITL